MNNKAFIAESSGSVSREDIVATPPGTPIDEEQPPAMHIDERGHAVWTGNPTEAQIAQGRAIAGEIMAQRRVQAVEERRPPVLTRLPAGAHNPSVRAKMQGDWGRQNEKRDPPPQLAGNPVSAFTQSSRGRVATATTRLVNKELPEGLWSIRSECDDVQYITGVEPGTEASWVPLKLTDNVVQNAECRIETGTASTTPPPMPVPPALPDNIIRFSENASGTFRISARVNVRLDTTDHSGDPSPPPPDPIPWIRDFQIGQLAFQDLTNPAPPPTIVQLTPYCKSSIWYFTVTGASESGHSDDLYIPYYVDHIITLPKAGYAGNTYSQMLSSRILQVAFSHFFGYGFWQATVSPVSVINVQVTVNKLHDHTLDETFVP